MDYKSFIEAIKNGDELAFEIFFTMEYKNVIFFICSYIGNESAAKDLAQESFISLWKRRGQIDSNYNLRSYLYTIARNKTLNYIRDNRLKKKNSLEHENLNLNFYALSHPSVIDEIDALEMEKLIDLTLEQLPEKIRRIFNLSRVENLTYKEIAQKENITIKAVEYQIKKALDIFRKRLGSYMRIF